MLFKRIISPKGEFQLFVRNVMNCFSYFRFFGCVFLLCAVPFAQIRVEESSTSRLKISWEIDKIDTVVVRSGSEKAVVLSFVIPLIILLVTLFICIKNIGNEGLAA